VHVYTHTCVCVHTYECMCTHIRVYVYTHTSACVHTYVCMCTHIRVYVYTHKYESVIKKSSGAHLQIKAFCAHKHATINSIFPWRKSRAYTAIICKCFHNIYVHFKRYLCAYVMQSLCEYDHCCNAVIMRIRPLLKVCIACSIQHVWYYYTCYIHARKFSRQKK
jgi:hypothetical protein